MSYNFSYPYQYGTEHHWPFITGDTLVLNLFANSQQCCYDKSASSSNLNRPAIYSKPNCSESLNNWARSGVTPDQKPCLPCSNSNHDHNSKPYPDDHTGCQPNRKPCPDTNHDHNSKPHPDDHTGCQPNRKPCPDTNHDQKPYPDTNHDHNLKPHPDDHTGCQDDGEPYTVIAKEITATHADPNKECGYYAGYYQSYGHVGRYGFNTACILKKWFPNFYENPALKEKLENVTSPVMAGNFKLAIVGDNIDYTWAKASDMWCRQCQNNDNDKACTWEHNGAKAHSTCYTAGSNGSTIYSHNFFSETECPNLISSEIYAKEKPKEIYIKLVEPIVLYDHSTQKIISRDGKMTDQNYFTCKEYINSNFTNDGKAVENSCDTDYYKAQCQSCIKALEEALWTAEDPIKLKIPTKKQVAYFPDHSDTQNKDPFSSLGHNKMQDDEASILMDDHSLM